MLPVVGSINACPADRSPVPSVVVEIPVLLVIVKGRDVGAGNATFMTNASDPGATGI